MNCKFPDNKLWCFGQWSFMFLAINFGCSVYCLHLLVEYFYCYNDFVISFVLNLMGLHSTGNKCNFKIKHFLLASCLNTHYFVMHFALKLKHCHPTGNKYQFPKKAFFSSCMKSVILWSVLYWNLWISIQLQTNTGSK